MKKNGWAQAAWAALSQLMLTIADGAIWMSEYAGKKASKVSGK